MVVLDNVSKIYGKGEGKLAALYGVNLHLKEGAFCSIIGPSGSGKTTLMNIVGCLDLPSSGTYRLDGKTIGKLGSSKAAAVRNGDIGFIFQSFNLICSMSALENVELPLLLRGEQRIRRRQCAKAALELVGLGNRLSHRPSELSGGQQQRVAIARVLAADPKLILADEPTGNLDSVSGYEIMNIITALNKSGKTVMLITHDKAVAACAHEIYKIQDGILTREV